MRRCRDTAGRLIGSASAISFTGRSPAPSNSTIARRLASPSASKGSPCRADAAAANLLEVVVVERDDGTELVIHAVRMRRGYETYLPPAGGHAND